MEERERTPMQRRELLRRAAIVGGNLLWIAPAIQTLAPKAMAGGGSPVFGCCECRNGAVGHQLCNGVDHVECVSSGAATSSAMACAQYCASLGKAYCFHASPTQLTCVTFQPGNSFPRSMCAGG
jgi:hypothetical protein